ncbi:MAG: DUF3016 domain-containing protein [Rudaea sp.]
MHTRPYLFAIALACALAPAAASTARVQVTWAPDQQLSEVKENPMQRGWLRTKDWEKSLGDYLARRADRLLSSGQQLQVTIDDIKLAGSFEPWHGPDAHDIRIIKGIYPPRIDLHYRLTAADGGVIREGAAKLRDLAYLQRTVPVSPDSLPYEKRMLDDWLKKEFRPAQ